MAREYSQLALSQFADQMFQRFQRVEAQLALVSEKLGLTFELPTAGVPPEVVELAYAGDRVGAMKRYRELTGASRDDAQEIVSKL
jgi:hypothetical protein